jgi:histidine triad (HIT) family protein
MAAGAGCRFCQVAWQANYVVFEDDLAIAFLDYRPLFIGHTLLIPRIHYETLADLPAEFIGPFFSTVQLLARAVEKAMQAEGTFVAINNRVSQSVPHLHVHIVPRRKKDGLRGFFWPRQAHPDEEAMKKAQAEIRNALFAERSVGFPAGR